MARLSNGLETMELGVTSWRIIINDNFGKLYVKNELYNKNESDARYATKNGDAALDFTVKNIDVKGLLKLGSVLPAAPLPAANPSGYIKAEVSGKVVKIPYYEV